MKLFLLREKYCPFKVSNHKLSRQKFQQLRPVGGPMVRILSQALLSSLYFHPFYTLSSLYTPSILSTPYLPTCGLLVAPMTRILSLAAPRSPSNSSRNSVFSLREASCSVSDLSHSRLSVTRGQLYNCVSPGIHIRAVNEHSRSFTVPGEVP